MSEGYGADFITIIDEEGNELELELLDTLEHNGQIYMAFFPAVHETPEEGELEEGHEEERGLIILKAIEEDGEEFLSTLDSDEELDEVYELFMKELEELCEEEDD